VVLPASAADHEFRDITRGPPTRPAEGIIIDHGAIQPAWFRAGALQIDDSKPGPLRATTRPPHDALSDRSIRS